VSELGYALNLAEICKREKFNPEDVVTAELVFPKGAVPNAQLIWVRVEVKSGDRKFITLPLRDFYQYVDLPTSSIGGWTDGDRGSDRTGLNARYEIVHSGGAEEVHSRVLDGPEGPAEAMETPVSDEVQSA
jgi:hypothetical protein